MLRGFGDTTTSKPQFWGYGVLGFWGFGGFESIAPISLNTPFFNISLYKLLIEDKAVSAYPRIKGTPIPKTLKTSKPPFEAISGWAPCPR